MKSIPDLHVLQHPSTVISYCHSVWLAAHDKHTFTSKWDRYHITKATTTDPLAYKWLHEQDKQHSHKSIEYLGFFLLQSYQLNTNFIKKKKKYLKRFLGEVSQCWCWIVGVGSNLGVSKYRDAVLPVYKLCWSDDFISIFINFKMAFPILVKQHLYIKSDRFVPQDLPKQTVILFSSKLSYSHWPWADNQTHTSSWLITILIGSLIHLPADIQ